VGVHPTPTPPKKITNINIKDGARYDYGEKVDLGKGYWNPKRKMWVTTHFSDRR